MYEDLSENKREIEKLLPLPDEAQKKLNAQLVLDLVCAGCSFDGGSFTRKEVQEILEEDKTVAGHALKEHITVLNAAHVWNFIKEESTRHTGRALDEKDVRDIHRIAVRAVFDEDAGMYRGIDLKFGTTEREMPSPAKVQRLMSDFGMWLYTAQSLHPIAMGAEAHLKLMAIQPFAQRNSTVARSLMNLIAMRHGYPPVLFLRREKKEYWQALEKAVFENDRSDYDKLVARAARRSMEAYKKASVVKEFVATDPDPYFLRIGGLAKESGERVSTIRFWTSLGLLETAGKTSAGYVLYSSDALETIQRLRKLKDERYTLDEIREIVHAQ